jgi:hypothetical protein
MEDKRGIKRERSLFAEGSPSPSDAKTPSSAPSESPPPPRSPYEITSRHPCSPVFEQGAFGKAPVIDLSSSSDEEDLIAATSRDFEFTQRLFGELNHAVLGPPGEDMVIILDDSDEEKEAQEEKIAGTDPATTSVAVNPASTASADAPAGVKNDNSDDQGPNQEDGGGNGNGGGGSEP